MKRKGIPDPPRDTSRRKCYEKTTWKSQGDGIHQVQRKSAGAEGLSLKVLPRRLPWPFGRGTMLVGWHEPTEWMTLGKFTGSALGTKKIIYRTSFGPETSFQPLNFLGPAWSHAGPTWSLRCPDSLFLWEGARGNTPPMPIRPCWSDYEGIMVVRLPQKKKTHHQPQSKSNNFHPILSRVHISEASNLVGKPSNPPPPQLSASNSSPGQRKNSNFACKNGNLQSSFPENKNQPSKTSCQKKKTQNRKNSIFHQNWCFPCTQIYSSKK